MVQVMRQIVAAQIEPTSERTSDPKFGTPTMISPVGLTIRRHSARTAAGSGVCSSTWYKLTLSKAPSG